MDHCTQSGLTNLKDLFFGRSDTIMVQKLRENFARIRTWPILEESSLLEQLVREGVRKGIWCLFRMDPDENTEPAEFYDREKGELPLRSISPKIMPLSPRTAPGNDAGPRMRDRMRPRLNCTLDRRQGITRWLRREKLLNPSITNWVMCRLKPLIRPLPNGPERTFDPLQRPEEPETETRSDYGKQRFLLHRSTARCY